MGSKILFRNTTTYTEDIAFEAGEAFWETQPAYKKRVKKYKVVAAIMGVTFAIAAVASLVKSGPMLLTLGAVAMALAAGFIPVHLGASRLRTETAALTAAASVYFKHM